jgi:hypothetical protein
MITLWFLLNAVMRMSPQVTNEEFCSYRFELHRLPAHPGRSRAASSGMLRRVTLVRTDVSEELSASIRMTRIGELGTTLAVTSNRGTLRRNAATSQQTHVAQKCLVHAIPF